MTHTTPLHHAVRTNDLQAIRELLGSTAPIDINAADAHGNSPLTYAAWNTSVDVEVMEFLIAHGATVNPNARTSTPPLVAAASSGNVRAVELLLEAGADVNLPASYGSALSNTNEFEIARQLLLAGADPKDLSFEARRGFLGFPPEPNIGLLDVSKDDFDRARHPRFGVSNPEEIDEPFWRGMIRSGVTGYQAADRFNGDSMENAPTWCAQRFGQSMTWLPDGRIIQIAGEHEDFYDPDFCIYNDVFVHDRDGSFRIYGYPADVFPPTDFHTATLVGELIYIVGSLGYKGSRQFGSTPVYVLDTRTFRIDRVDTTGDAPGWISRHRAVLSSPTEIRVDGGEIVTAGGDDDHHADNPSSCVLDLSMSSWRRIN